MAGPLAMLRDGFTVVMVVAGAIFFLAGSVGLLRFPDPLSRLHALAKADSLGLGLIVMGLLARAGSLLAALKLVAVWALAQLVAASISQIVARAARPGPELP